MARQSRVWRVTAIFLCLAVLVAACGSPVIPGGLAQPASTATQVRVYTPTPGVVVATPAPTLPVPPTFQEAPGLKGRVEAGQLPPVAERLPEKPKVVPVEDEIGQYGGTWDMTVQTAADEYRFIRTVAYEPLLRWTSDWSSLEPNLVETYTVNRNATEFTFTLRKGIRWSDGEPFTTNDIRFWYEEVLLNTSLTPITPYWLKTGGTMAVFNFVDEYTFTVKFASPNSLFLRRLATPDSLAMISFPAHYVKKYHSKYTSSDVLTGMIFGGRYKSWAEMFISKVGVTGLDNGTFTDPARPRLTAWVLRTSYNSEQSKVMWERNPYYWKVDELGNQLPYIDTVVFHTVESVDEVIMRAIDGQIDMQNLDSVGQEVLSRLGSREDTYRFYQLEDASNNVMVFNFNLAHPNPAKRKLFQNRNFRIALSYAINRQEIINLVFDGQGTPWQAAPRPESPFYNEEMATQYTEYDIDRANDILDKANFVRDTLGRRLDQEGMPISFVVYVPDNEPEHIAILNLIAREWSRLGIHVTPKSVSLPIFLATVRSNLHDSAVWRGGSTMFDDVLLDPSNYLPVSENTLWAVNWSNWYNKVQGFENAFPVESARTEMGMYDRIRGTNSLSEHLRLMKAALLVARANFWNIGIALGPERYGIVHKDFHNVPELMPSAWLFPDPGPANPEQFYISGSEN